MAGNGDHLILCAECDHVEETRTGLTNDDFDPDKEKKQCVLQWLTGQLLTNDDDGQSTTCDCFLSDSFPAAEWPQVKNKNRPALFFVLSRVPCPLSTCPLHVAKKEARRRAGITAPSSRRA